MIDRQKWKTKDKGLYNTNPWMAWDVGNDEIDLDGEFNINDLLWIANYMKMTNKRERKNAKKKERRKRSGRGNGTNQD